MIFQFMEKYRVPILIVVLIGLAGFGVWVFLADALGGGGGDDLGEVYATVEGPGDAKLEVTRGEFNSLMSRSDPQATPQDRAGRAMSIMMRRWMANNSGLHVSAEERNEVIAEVMRPIVESVGGENGETLRWNRANYTKFVSDRLGMTASNFEEALLSDMRLLKFFREAQRVSTVMPSAKAFDAARKNNVRVKVKGIFFDNESFKEAAKLSLDEDGNLSAADQERLNDFWRELSDAERRRFNTQGALVTTEVLGFSFKKNDDDFINDFKRANPKAGGKSLEELTAEFMPSEDDIAKLKLRLNRHKAVYGVEIEAGKLDEAFVGKKERLVAEWKILSLVAKLDAQARKELAETKKVDLEKLADANGLTFYRFNNVPIKSFQDEGSEFTGTWVSRFGAVDLEDGAFLKPYTASVTPSADAFFENPIDQVGRHASTWRRLAIDRNPEPALADVKLAVIDDFNLKEAGNLRDAAVEAFDKKVDDWIEAKIADFAKPIRDKAKEAIASLTKDLDSETQKDAIKKIEDEENAKADAEIDVEKAKHTNDAFAAILAEGPGQGVIVEEGYFLVAETRSEVLPDMKTASLEAKARAALRRDFDMLRDDIISDREVEVGTASEFIEARSVPGMKGRAMLVDKRFPTDEEILLHPNWLQLGELYAQVLGSRQSEGTRKSMWDYEIMTADPAFDFDLVKVNELIETQEKELRDQEERLRKHAEEKKRLREQAKN